MGKIKEIRAADITQSVARLCQEANFFLGKDVVAALAEAKSFEESEVARQVLDQILENARIAAAEHVPLCQDCGTAVVFLDLGQDVHISGGDLYTAVAEGVKIGYKEGYLRKSMVEQPFSARVNTEDNTPPVIHAQIVPGEEVRITVVPKGGGSENMSRFTALKPAQGRQGIIEFVVNAVDEAGSNPCPPVIVGVGIGGTAEETMALAKRALLREIGKPSPDAEVAELEAAILKRVNALGIGPGGFGGRTTALAVHVEIFPSHIASLPVAVNLQCHASRHRSDRICGQTVSQELL
ncbi:fumarate hydratase [Dehalococcoidia bacterium]|nr:fumarate hydratase [Dehalococcoidia bacterium]